MPSYDSSRAARAAGPDRREPKIIRALDAASELLPDRESGSTVRDRSVVGGLEAEELLELGVVGADDGLDVVAEMGRG